MAAEGADSGGGGRRRRAAVRQCAVLLAALVSALVHHTDAARGFLSLPHVDDAADWTYGVRDDVDWRRAPVGLPSTADTVSAWRRPTVSAGYPRRRRRTELDPDGRFIDSSAWKRRSTYKRRRPSIDVR